MLRALFIAGKPGEPGIQSPKRELSPRGEAVPGTPKAMFISFRQPDSVLCFYDRAGRYFIELDVLPQRH